ncbi:MAG: acetolactate synthase small subunit [Clostridia bacterium]|nr:acetolactate synthase small subunit [Clostridia bacterium]MDD4799222.1 acetolactate synthase small subunit [Clostridia bacterium]
MKQTLSVMVVNQTGVLARVAGLFSRRGFNIESLSVSTTEDKNISRMTIVVDGDEGTIEQVMKQLHKLIEVIKINNLTGTSYVDRGMALFKVAAGAAERAEVMQVVTIFRANIVDFCPNSLIIEATGSESKIAAIEEALRPFGIKEVVRTGEIAMARGIKAGSKKGGDAK